MAKPVNPDVKQVALEVLAEMFDHGMLGSSIASSLYWVSEDYKHYRHTSPDEAEAHEADVRNFIEAILEGEITMRKPSR